MRCPASRDLGGALANRERVSVRLEQGPVTEGGDVLQQVFYRGRDGRNCLAFDLCLARRRARIAAQATAEDRRAIATYLIENTGSVEELRNRVEKVYAELTRAP